MSAQYHYHIDLSAPLEERIRRYAVGSQAQTLRGLARYVLDHRPATVVRLTWRSEPATRRPDLTPEEREDRRAAADPTYRQTLLDRLYDELTRAQRDYGLAPERWTAIRDRIARIGGGAPVEPPACVVIGSRATREEVYAAAQAVGARVGARRARGWAARTTQEASRVIEAEGWTGWGRERDCPGEARCRQSAVRSPGAARRAGYRVHYHPAVSDTLLRAVLWVAAPDRVSLVVHDRRVDLPVPAGTTVRLDEGGEAVIVRPDAPVEVITLADAVRRVLAAGGAA